MALQPSFRFGRRRGHRVETTVGTTSEDANEAAFARQDAQNQLALQARPTAAINPDIAAQHALAKVLGYAENEPTPSLEALKLRFASLPSNVKAGIMRSTNASPLLPGSDDAEEMIGKRQTALEKIHDEHTNAVIQAMTQGKIEPIKSKDGQMQWVVNQEQDIDPNNPILGKKKVQVPANHIIQGYIDRAQQMGYIPSPESGKFPETAAPQLTKAESQRRMSSEDFQKVLDARENTKPPSMANVAANLASTKMPPTSTGASASTMSLTPYEYGSNMQLGKPYAYDNPLQFQETGEMMGPPAPPPRQGYFPSGQFAQDVGINAEAARNTAVDLGAGAVNLLSRGWNYGVDKIGAANKFLFGDDSQGGTQIPMVDRPLQQPLQPQELSNPADIAYFLSKRKETPGEQYVAPSVAATPPSVAPGFFQDYDSWIGKTKQIYDAGKSSPEDAAAVEEWWNTHYQR